VQDQNEALRSCDPEDSAMASPKPGWEKRRVVRGAKILNQLLNLSNYGNQNLTKNTRVV